MQMMIPAPVARALQRLQQAGYEAGIVGGCVRDRLMGREPQDYDITTAALPEQTAAVFADARVIETGLRHGTVTVLLDGEPLEITTYRIDGEYSDGRRPDSVRFTPSLTEDLARRDFTMNAMAYAPDTGLVDPFGGQADILAGCIRCVGEPERRFTEDALRILRALRFASVLGFSIEPETEAALRRCAPLLHRISAERIAAELKKLLCGADVRRVLLRYADVLGEVLPEILPMVGFDQKNPYHCYDILEHSAAAVEAIAPEPELRFAALLHDIGKPDCFFTDERGVGHFYGHAARSAELADAILTRLRFDRAGRERIVTLVRRHDRPIEVTETAVRRALNRLSPSGFSDLLALMRADCLAQAPAYRSRLETYDRLEAMAKEILAAGQCFSLRDLAVSGRDLGLPPGPAVGKALASLLDSVMDGRVENRREALLEYLRQHSIK